MIENNWLERWKTYVDYKAIEEKLKSYQNTGFLDRVSYNLLIDPMYDCNPCCIANDKLLIDHNEFLNDGNKSNIENIILKRNLNVERDVKFINKKAWEFFYNFYGGGPEIKLMLDGENIYEITSEILNSQALKVNIGSPLIYYLG